MGNCLRRKEEDEEEEEEEDEEEEQKKKQDGPVDARKCTLQGPMVFVSHSAGLPHAIHHESHCCQCFN